jgi:TM2 domain-containing membrane protein YozV
MGGLFLISEASALAFAAYWRDEADWRNSETARFRDSSAAVKGRGESAGDSALLYRAGWYSVIADQSGFEARGARSTAYSALALALGVHLYNFLDALEAGGAAARGAEKNPTAAGFLAAAPFLGLGQMYNERPGKAGLIIVAQTSLALTAYSHHRQMGFASEKYNQMRDTASTQYQYRAEYLGYWKGRYDDSFSRRNTYLWVSLAVYLYSIFDAVVDAHLSDYQEKIKVGSDLAVEVGGGGAAVSLTLNLGF